MAISSEFHKEIEAIQKAINEAINDQKRLVEGLKGAVKLYFCCGHENPKKLCPEDSRIDAAISRLKAGHYSAYRVKEFQNNSPLDEPQLMHLCLDVADMVFMVDGPHLGLAFETGLLLGDQEILKKVILLVDSTKIAPAKYHLLSDYHKYFWNPIFYGGVRSLEEVAFKYAKAAADAVASAEGMRRRTRNP